MAALPQPQHDYHSHSHHAEPGHVHRYLRRGYTDRLKCIYCDAEEIFVLRAEKRRLERRVEELEAAMLEIHRMPPRVNGARYGGLASAKEIASTQIALSNWRDNDEQEQAR